MDTNVNYALVGAFVIVLLTALVLIIIWLSSGLSLESYTIYKVNMEESVSGLNVDAAVEFNGVNVGSVKSVSLGRKDPNIVKILLSIKSRTPVTEGTVATLSTRGLTGITYVALKDTGTNLTPLRAKPGKTYPVIKTAPSFFLQLDTVLNKMTTSFSDLSNSIQTLLNKENQQSVRAILFNLRKATAALANESEKFSAIVENTSKASLQFTPMIHAGKNAMQMFENQTLPYANRVLNNLDAVSHNLLDISTELKRNPSVLVRGVAPQNLGPGEGK